jgi:hypothetical protein
MNTMRAKIKFDQLPQIRAKAQADIDNKKIPAIVRLKARRLVTSIDRMLSLHEKHRKVQPDE